MLIIILNINYIIIKIKIINGIQLYRYINYNKYVIINLYKQNINNTNEIYKYDPNHPISQIIYILIKTD